MSTETAQDVLDNNLTCQVDDVVVWYQIGKQNLHYLDVSQAVSNNTLVQFWKHSEGKKTHSQLRMKIPMIVFLLKASHQDEIEVS